MTPLTLEQARALLEQKWADEQAGPYHDPDDDGIIRHIDERDWGWVMYWDTLNIRKLYEAGEVVCGGGPYFVNKYDGTVFMTGSGRSTEAYLAEYESQIDAGIKTPSIYRQNSMFEKLELFVAMISPLRIQRIQQIQQKLRKLSPIANIAVHLSFILAGLIVGDFIAGGFVWKFLNGRVWPFIERQQ